MNLTRDRLNLIGWAGAVALALVLTVGLTLRVNATKSRVKLAERQIVELKREKLFLETEFETRANQRQLAELNAVDFGYRAPTAGQYVEGERQLAALGKPREATAPAPIRMARADAAGDGLTDRAALIPAMVSPLTGHFAAEAQAATPPGRKPVSASTLRDRLSRVEPHARTVRE
ncbi:MAG: hypothetical protein JSS36_02575 [Proteobacteria bacterium]|nr:hypothetical protein [Pseudomonadota bacterium]